MTITQQQIEKSWASVPEGYWPSVDKPWRVTWAFGVHEDFATEDEADRFHAYLLEDQKGDWKNLVNEPFNVHERTLENLK